MIPFRVLVRLKIFQLAGVAALAIPINTFLVEVCHNLFFPPTGQNIALLLRCRTAAHSSTLALAVLCSLKKHLIAHQSLGGAGYSI